MHLELGVLGGEDAAGEHDDGGYSWVVKALNEDFLADKAGCAGKADLHCLGGYWVAGKFG